MPGPRGEATPVIESGRGLPHSIDRALVVSLHDVSPRTRDACERILRELQSRGVEACSLLVIPDHHHRGHIAKDPEFCAWLRGLALAGHEIVLHGYFHQRQRRAAEGIFAKVTTRFYTAGEGEFYDIARADALELVSTARAEFHALGFTPAGFIAPAWLLSADAQSALIELGFGYTTRLGSVLDLQHNRTFRSQSLVWSVRSAWRRVTSRLWNRLLFQTLAGSGLLRISIHPVDIEHRSVWAQICSLVSAARINRQAVTYQRWIESQHIL